MSAPARSTLPDDLSAALNAIAAKLDSAAEQEVMRVVAERLELGETLIRLGRSFSAELDHQTLVQRITDEATKLVGAQFGAFFWNVVESSGEAYLLYTLAGAPREAFAKFGQPRATPLFGPTFRGEAPIRSGNIRKDPRYGQWAPHHGMPKGHLPVVSYLAVPVIARNGDVLGGLFFGHPEEDRFTAGHEALIIGLAAQAAVALENAKLYSTVRRSEQRLQLALSAGRLGAWEWDIRANRVTWSPLLEELHGIPEGSFAGTFEAAVGLVHEADRARVVEDLEAVVAERRRTHQVCYRIVRADGQVRWLESYGQLVVEEDVVARLTGVCQDVTERLATEETARRLAAEQAMGAFLERQAKHAGLRADIGAALNSSGTMRATLQTCAQATVDRLGVSFARIWLVDAEGKTLLLEASAGKYTHIDGAHARVPVGKFKIGLIAEEARPHLTNDVQHDQRVGDREWARREGMVSFAGYPLLADGRVIGVWAMFATVPLPDDTLSALASVSDALAQGIVRKRAEHALSERAEELARSNRELEQFAYVASHDLQEPLRMVASYTQLLGKRYRGKLDADADEFIGFAVSGVERMQRLIQDLLAFSRVGSRTRDATVVDVRAAVSTALTNLMPALEESGARVTVEPDLPAVRADDGQVAQVFQNLISNAIKFRQQDRPAEITVSGLREGRWCRFMVRDNGIGIDAAFFERIFVIFQRLHPVGRFPGTGMGLAICKKIVERHGGSIGVESTPGTGSTFWFTLPAA